jgi:hypothetical protein
MERREMRIEVIDEADVHVLRAMSQAQKLWAANRMVVQARAMLRHLVTTQNPSWTQRQVDVEVTERLGNGRPA